MNFPIISEESARQERLSVVPLDRFPVIDRPETEEDRLHELRVAYFLFNA